MTELRREQVEALLITEEGKPYAQAHRIVLAHDAAQRARVEEVEEGFECAEHERIEWVKRGEHAEAENDRLRARVAELESEVGQARVEVTNRAYFETDLRNTLDRLKAALESIADNTCCGPCQEAALVAQRALEPPAPPAADTGEGP